MKKQEILCSRCNGTGLTDEYLPHVRTPAQVACPQCKGRGHLWVVVPEDDDELEEAK